MIKVKSNEYLKDMGFVPKNNKGDYVFYGVGDDDTKRKLFTVYAGSPYIRYSTTSYVMEVQLKCVYDWAKKDYIEWED